MKANFEQFIKGSMADSALTTLPVEGELVRLKELADECHKKRNYESAFAACQGTRATWNAIHQRALYNPMLLSPEMLAEAEHEIERCIKALKGVRVPTRDRVQRHRVRDKFPSAMRQRKELVRLLADKGITALTRKLQELAA